MIRPATLDDMDGIVAVREAFSQALDARGIALAPHDPSSTRTLITAYLANPKAGVFVGERNEQIVGLVVMLVFPYPMNLSVQLATQTMLFVLPEARGCGIGSGLCQAGEDWAIQQEARAVLASTRDNLGATDWMLHHGYHPLEHTFVKRVR